MSQEIHGVYDLEDRTKRFSIKTIQLCKKISVDIVSRPIIDQVVRSATSIGANYQEANGALSMNDFKNKIFLCKKEAKETMYWLDVLREVICEDERLEHEWLRKEAHELVLIFSKIASTSHKKE